MAPGDTQEGKWRGNWRMEWVACTLHTTSEHGVPSITTADAHTSAASSRLNWRPRRFKWTRPFRRTTKSGFCVCAITFQLASIAATLLHMFLSLPVSHTNNNLKVWHPHFACRARNNNDAVRWHTPFITANPTAATYFGCTIIKSTAIHVAGQDWAVGIVTWRSGDRISVGARFSAPVQTGPEPTHPPKQWVPARLNWRLRQFKWTRPFRRKTKLVSARVPSHFNWPLPKVSSILGYQA